MMKAAAWIEENMTARLSRRTILRGLGTAIALPWLEAMLPLSPVLAAAAPVQPPRRMAFLYVPNGMNMAEWTPEKTGTDFELKPTMEPLAPFKSELTVLSNLTLDGARAHADGGGDHARSVAAFLTGAHPRKTSGANIKNGVSVDQVAAAKIGSQTRFPSLELGCEPSANSGDCDSGYSCAYSSNVSWRDETTPVAKEVNPRALFDRLFGNGDDTEEGRSRYQRKLKNQSVLDFALADATALQNKLGAADKQKLEEYLYSVREVERRITGGDKLAGREEGVPDYPRPSGVPAEFVDHLRLMMDLMTLSLQTDSTRILTFMYTNDSSNRSYPGLDVKDGHHELSHHGGDKGKQAKIAKINRHHVEQFAYFLGKLQGVKEGAGTLLDNCLVLYGSGIADGDAHDHHDLPLVLAGRGGGSIQPGRHLRAPRETPLTNLYLSLLDRMGAPTDKLADSTGRLNLES
jgi:hypothetical protein